ncbi:hypothetical protein ACTXL1_05455 [Psychrobacter celer]
MDTQQAASSIWQQMVQQSFLSLYETANDDTLTSDQFQGYDFVFEFSDARIYMLVNDVIRQASQHDIDSSQVREWRKEVVNQLIKRHAALYQKNDKSLTNSDVQRDKAVYFVGLTSLAVQHHVGRAEAPTYAIGYEYGSQFFAEDCVLDLDDEQSVLQVFSY